MNKIDLLLINYHEFYLIENKCGHFGISLADGRLTDNAIVCSGHGISFDLVTGKKINRPYENCDDIKTYPVTEIDENLYCCLTQPIQS
ncbi:MAG: Rieske 2Fe-2S domain-containing protein [Methylococcales bacterium]|nr:Rieske 2Fe-2S domain-containing protein [Methylococcales bacterium]